MHFLGATLRAEFELAIETPEGPVSDVGRAIKTEANLMNGSAPIRTADESAGPDTWLDK
ncbi:hypothetical protein ABIC89_002382 [Variovorax boronicumulans]|uniref:hypothetical protein n=1 Tax=Variovorax boronicumulans TaxID=436515 RepID=UPI0033989C55